jgi:hypothetical protein
MLEVAGFTKKRSRARASAERLCLVSLAGRAKPSMSFHSLLHVTAKSISLARYGFDYAWHMTMQFNAKSKTSISETRGHH